MFLAYESLDSIDALPDKKDELNLITVRKILYILINIDVIFIMEDYSLYIKKIIVLHIV